MSGKLSFVVRVALLCGLLVASGCSAATTGTKIPAYDAPRTAVLVLDLQRDFIEDEGRLPVAATQRRSLLDANNRIVRSAQAHGVLVAYVRSEFGRGELLANWWRHQAAVVGSPGAAFDPRVAVVSDDVFTKATSDAFSNPELDAWLRAHRVDHLVVTGVFANHCVAATVEGARNRGYHVIVPADAVAGSDDDAVASGLAEMRGVGAEVSTSERVAAALEGLP